MVRLSRWAGRKALVHPLGGDIPRLIAFLGEWMRGLSIFDDESGEFGPLQNHSPLYILRLVFRDQSDDISGHLDKIHAALQARGPSAVMPSAPLIRQERDYRWLEPSARRSIRYDPAGGHLPPGPGGDTGPGSLFPARPPPDCSSTDALGGDESVGLH